EDDEALRNAMVDLIGNGDVHTIPVGNGEQALKALKDNRIDCMVLDLGLPDMSGFQLIEQVRDLGCHDLRIVIYTGRELTKQEVTQLHRVAETIIIKEARSLDRLLDETSLFLHRDASNLPESKRKKMEEARHMDTVLQDKKVLIV